MIHTPTYKEIQLRKQETIDFCKQPGNRCEMNNHMRLIKQIRKEATEKHIQKVTSIIEENIMYAKGIENDDNFSAAVVILEGILEEIKK